MFRRIAAAIVLSGALAGTASAGHHYYYSYPAWGSVYGYSAPVYAAPVYVPPVVVPAAAYYIPSPVYYRSAPVYHAPVYHAPVRHSYYRGFRPYRGVEVEVEWKRDGYEIEVDYD